MNSHLSQSPAPPVGTSTGLCSSLPGIFYRDCLASIFTDLPKPIFSSLKPPNGNLQSRSLYPYPLILPTLHSRLEATKVKEF